MTRQNFENNLRILVNIEKFSSKNLKIFGFRQYVLKNYSFFLYFLIKIILFTLKNYLFAPKIAFKIFFTTKHAKSFVKINFLVTFLHFQVSYAKNFEDKLRILANFGKFSRKNSKNLWISPIRFQKTTVFFFFNKHYTFYTKNLFIQPKNCVQSPLCNERCRVS